MKIRTRIGLSALVTSCAALVIGAVIALEFKMIESLEHQSEDHRTLMQGMTELELLTHEYFIDNDKLAESRWLQKFAVLSKTFAAMRGHTHAIYAELAPMQRKLDQLKAHFLQRVSAPEQFPAAQDKPAAVETTPGGNLTGSIIFLARSLSADAAAIEARAWHDLKKHVHAAHLLIYFLVGGLVVFLASATLTLGRSITRPMRRLRDGAEIIGSGDLEHRIDSRRDDEFGDLAQSFNAMAERLKSVLVSRDNLESEIQARRLAEEEVRQLNSRLEQRVLERTRQLKQTNDELTAFTYSVSHDLRAPLRSIGGFTQILLEDNAAQLDEDGTHNLQRVLGGVQRMTQLIDDLLRLSQISRAQVQPRITDLSILARTIADELAAASPERAVSWVIAPGITAGVDSGLMRIALDNLLRNSWKYTGKHGAARIEFGAEARGGETVYFVRDDGAGFDMANAGKLFGAFQRLHGKDAFEGSGIGLTIVQRIIHRHGGRVWAESAVEQGATFFFTLPGGTALQHPEPL